MIALFLFLEMRREDPIEYSWLDTVEEYSSYIHSPKAIHTIGIVSPRESSRRDRWADVLHWWGFEPATVLGGEWLSADRIDSSFSPRKLMLLDESFGLAAKHYARQSKKELMGSSDPFAMLGDLREATSILFVGRPEQFTYQFVSAFAGLAAEKNWIWGVVAATDFSHLTFLFAKLLAASRGGAPREIRSEYFLDALTRETEPGAIRPLFEGHLKCLSIACHGEGAHGNLHSVVICGRVSEQEKIRGLVLDGGCRSGFCKRASQRPNVEVRLGCELMTESLFLWTCNGFSIAGEMYPSDLSLVMSAADGYPANMVASKKVVALGAARYQHWVQNIGPTWGETVRYFNTASYETDGHNPFILFGDPDLATPVVKSASSPKFDLLENKFEIPLGDHQRLGWLRHLEASLIRNSACAVDPKGSEVFAKLGQLLRELENRFVVAARRSQIAQTSENWSTELSERLKKIDPILTYLAANFLTSESGLDSLDMGVSSKTIFSDRQCPRCANKVMEIHLQGSLFGQFARVNLTCPLCGALSQFSPSSGEMTGTVIGVPRAGETFQFRIRWISPLPASNGYLIFQLKDKAYGKKITEQIKGVGFSLANSETEIEIPLPSGMGKDLHTLRIMFVAGGNITFLRQRIPLTLGN